MAGSKGKKYSNKLHKYQVHYFKQVCCANSRLSQCNQLCIQMSRIPVENCN